MIDPRRGDTRAALEELVAACKAFDASLVSVCDIEECGCKSATAARTFRDAIADAASLLAASGGASSGWEPIETAPKMRTLLLFAVTDIAEDGTVRNWKMATGSWHTGYEDERSKARGYTPWEWGGHQLKAYEVQPTHWMPLPAPPSGGETPPSIPPEHD